MFKYLKISVIAMFLIVPLVGCESMGNKESAGTVIGGVSGALIGSQFGHGDGRLLGAAVGAAAGAFAGNRVGASMDDNNK